MGVDISGRDPIIRGQRPAINWDTASDAEKDIYWEAYKSWEEENPGDYFRANWWSWRPIHMLIEHVNETHDLGIDTSYYGSNDGAGVEDQETCNRLADALEEIINGNTKLNDEDDRVYLVLGSWSGIDGSYISQESLDDIADELPEYGSILYAPFVAANGQILTSAHSTSLWHLRAFVKFLRECGGFEIW